ncbi:MAG: hypothetical protein H0V79_02675 [Actinobacteria bacterium]|nr:hypothetical protein [Actinomycetota bacterium]
MAVSVTVRPEIPGDFQNLPTHDLRLEAARYLLRLRDHPWLGLPLADHPKLGDLSDCRKIYFDEHDDIPPRYRIVYKLSLDESGQAKGVDVVIVGPRASEQVYREALARLGR